MSKLSMSEYWGVGELEPAERCPTCGALATTFRYRDLRDQLEGVPGSWNFRECAHCGTLFLDPRPSQSAIGKAYLSSSYLTHQSSAAVHAADNGSSLGWRLSNGYLNTRYGCRRSPATSVGRWLLPWLLPLRQQLDYFYRYLPKPPGLLLDVGCGNGAFLLRAIEAGWQVQGIEPDSAAAEQARHQGMPVHAGDINDFVADRQFDVITLSHVFEHLHDPAAMLQRCESLLKPGGRLWMALPNVQSWTHAVYRHAWLAIDPPRHLFLPTRRELLRLCRAAGYEQIRLLKRGRSGAAAQRLSAERAGKLGLSCGPAWLWRLLTDVGAAFSDRWADEFVLIARKPMA